MAKCLLSTFASDWPLSSSEQNAFKFGCKDRQAVSRKNNDLKQNRSALADISIQLGEEQNGQEVAVTSNEQDKKDETICQLKAKIEELERKLGEVNNEQRMEKMECNRLRSEKANVVEMLKQHTEIIAQLCLAVRNLNVENAALRRQNSELESKVQKANKVIAAWKKQFEALVTKTGSAQFIPRCPNDIIAQLNCAEAAMMRHYELDRTVNAVEACVQCGYDIDTVMEAKREIERRHGYNPADLMAVIFEMEDQRQ